MSPLKLAPWEETPLLRAAPNTSGVFTIPWQGQPTPFHFTVFQVTETVSPSLPLLTRRIIFTRPQNSEDEGNWLVAFCRNIIYGAASSEAGQGPEWFTTENALLFLAEVAASLNDDEDLRYELVRLIAVPRLKRSERAVFAVVEWDGRATWIDWLNERFGVFETLRDVLGGFAGATGRIASFQIDPSTPFRTDGRALFDYFESELADPTSRPNFAWKWGQLIEREKFELLTGGPEGAAEFRRVMAWAIQAEPSLWQEGDSWCWMLMDCDSYAEILDCNYLKFEGELPFLSRIGEFLIERFIPSRSAALLEKYPHTCHYFPDDKYESTLIKLILTDVSVEAATAHERVEALLNLKLWTRENATEKEFQRIWGMGSE